MIRRTHAKVKFVSRETSRTSIFETRLKKRPPQWRYGALFFVTQYPGLDAAAFAQ